MIVNVAGHPDFALGREVHDLLMAHRAETILLCGGAEGFNDLIGVQIAH